MFIDLDEPVKRHAARLRLGSKSGLDRRF